MKIETGSDTNIHTVFIDFTCPFCNKEVEDNDDVLLGEIGNIDSLDIHSNSPKQFFHQKCYDESKSDK